MSDSQPPKHDPAVPSFEVPDLEIEPVRRSFQKPEHAPTSPRVAEEHGQGRGYTAPNLFEEDGFQAGSLSLDLDPIPSANSPRFGSSSSFEDPDSFEVERTATPNLSLDEAKAPEKASERIEHAGGHGTWPTGRAPDLTQLELDPMEIAILADYGAAPHAVQLTPGYAYRVFTRQRELKRQLVAVAAECERAQVEREASLAELAHAVRPATESVEQFQRLLVPLRELERVASERGQALSSINQQLAAHSEQFEAELSHIADRVAAQQQLERDALRTYEEREATAKRAEAKLKRIHIEIRALTQVAEQKLGPAGGEIPEPEATQMSALRQSAQDSKPEVAHAQAELAQASAALGQVRSGLDALRQSERLSSRKKQAVTEQYRKELHTRSQGVTDSDHQKRVVLADLGRAVLAAAGTIDVPDAWLARIRSVGERADKLLLRREMQVRAIDSYDQARVRQGVQLVGTLVGVLVLLVLLKLVL